MAINIVGKAGWSDTFTEMIEYPNPLQDTIVLCLELNKSYIYIDNEWVLMTDDVVKNTGSLALKQNKTHIGPTAPLDPTYGDEWIKT